MTRKIECIGLSLFCSMALSAVVSPLNAETLTWDGGENGVWKKDGAGWKNAANEACQWQDGSEAILTGARVIVAEEGVTASKILSQGADLTVAGGKISMNGEAPEIGTDVGAAIKIEAPVSVVTNGLTLLGSPDLLFPNYLTENDQLIFPGAKLSQIHSWGALTGGIRNGEKYSLHSPFLACYEEKTEEGCTVQFQYRTDSNMYGLKVQFSEKEDGIYAKVIYCRYISLYWWGYPAIGTINYDTVTTGATFSTSAESDGCGISSVLAYKKDMDGEKKTQIVLSDDVDIIGDLTIEQGKVQIGGNYGINYGLYGGKVNVRGDLVLNFNRGQIFSGPMTGEGSCTVLGPATSIPVKHNGSLTGDYVLMAENAQLSQVRRVTGKLIGQYVRPESIPSLYFFKNDGTNATFQLQFYEDPYLKCIMGELKQDGADIWAKIAGCRSLKPSRPGVGSRFTSGYTDQFIATNNDEPGYGIQDFTIFFEPGVTFSQSCTVVGGIRVSGPVTVQAMKKDSLPSSGNILVENNAFLLVSNSGSEQVGGANPLILRNAKARFEYGHTFLNWNGTYRKAILDGSVCGLNTQEDGYFNDLELLNGGQFAEHPLQVGYGADPKLYVGGKGPCTIPEGLLLVRSAAKTFYIDVDDTTGDEVPDLYIQKKIGDMGGYGGLAIEKRGSGTMSIAATNNAIGEVRVDKGVLRLDSPFAIGEVNNLFLKGGTIANGTFTNHVGTLTVTTTNCVLDLTSGGTFTFKDSSQCAWGEDAVLTIKGDLKNKNVRFGTDGNGLTEDQLSKIDAGAYPVYISDEGYLKSFNKGTVLFLK